jgi:hypothetical protein
MKTKLFLFIGAAIIGLALTATLAAAQQVQWSGTAYRYDGGAQPTLAAHPSGLVLEFHRAGAWTLTGGNTLWYHVGRIQGNTIAWGGSLRAPGTGSWPNVAITPDGYVLYVWSGAEDKFMSTLYYQVGKIDLNGNEGQAIEWLTNGKDFDAGFHSTMAMNASGTFVEAHESGNGGKGLYYRVGHLANPAGGNYNLVWNSGGNGRYYDDGVNPHIAINNNNQVVEVHQVSSNEFLLHYHRGTVLSNGTIDFRASQRFEDYGSVPVVALLDSGLVLEVHLKGTGQGVICSPGRLNPSNPEIINWYTRFNVPDVKEKYGALATDGTNFGPRVAIGAWGESTTGDLQYEIATLADQ